MTFADHVFHWRFNYFTEDTIGNQRWFRHNRPVTVFLHGRSTSTGGSADNYPNNSGWMDSNFPAGYSYCWRHHFIHHIQFDFVYNFSDILSVFPLYVLKPKCVSFFTKLVTYFTALLQLKRIARPKMSTIGPTWLISLTLSLLHLAPLMDFSSVTSLKMRYGCSVLSFYSSVSHKLWTFA